MAKLPNPPRVDHAGNKLPPLLDCRPFRITGLTEAGKPFEPKPFEPGSRIEWEGRTGEVWSLARGGVFAIADDDLSTVVHVALRKNREPVEVDRFAYGKAS